MIYKLLDNIRLKLLLLSIVLFLSIGALSQPFCKVKTFSIADGLAANTMSEFGQTPDGVVWVATWNGLCCYDGYMFRIFRNKAGKERVLSTNRIHLIRPNTIGDVWCVTSDSHLYLFDRVKYSYIDVDKVIRSVHDVRYNARNVISLKNGHAWVLGKDDVCFRIDEREIKQGRGIELYATGKGKVSGPIRKVVLDENGCEWLFAKNGVALYGTDILLGGSYEYICRIGHFVYLSSPDGHLGVYRDGGKTVHDIKLPHGISRINGMHKVGGNMLVMATDRGVLVCDTRRMTFRIVSVSGPSHPDNEVKDIFVDNKKRIWAYGNGMGLSLISGRYDRAEWLPAIAADASGTICRQNFFHQDKHSVVWASPNGGAFSYYDEDRKCLVPYSLNTASGAENSVNTITKYISDVQGNLWLTGTHDLTLVNFRYYKFIVTDTRGGEDARSITVDNAGNYLVGLRNGCIAVHGKNREFMGFVTPSGGLSPLAVPLSGFGIYSLFTDSRGRVWAGSKGDGLFMLVRNSKGYTVTNFRSDARDKTAINNNSIYDIKEDGRGRIWVATYGGGLNFVSETTAGKFVFTNSGNTMRPLPDGDFDRVRHITVAPGDVIIASTTGGMVAFSARFVSPSTIKYHTYYSRQGDLSTLHTPDVMQTHVSKNGKLYVSTMGGGLQEADFGKLLTGNMSFRNVDAVDNNEGIVQSISEDARGNIWLVRESSIDMYNPDTGGYNVYGPGCWNGNIEFTEASALSSVSGNNISVCTTGGFLYFNPANVSKSSYVPLIVFSGIQYPGDSGIMPVGNGDELSIPSDKRNFTIYFAAIDYSDNRLIRYAYKINELDDDWIYSDAGTHGASFSHIPAGHYTLVVKSTNADGVWTDNVRELKIYVRPTFWETGWAYAIYLFIILALLSAAFYMYRLRNMASMERRIKERQLIFFTDISHRLRTPLTLIGGPVAQVLRGEQLTDKARKYLEFVDKNARRMLELVDKTLDLKKLQDINDTITTSDIDTSASPAEAQTTVANMDGEPVCNDKTTILVVEDNDELRFFLSTSLDGEYQVYEASNGEEGLSIAMERQPDFIITDIMMPVMDGMTMIRRLKETPDVCHIPIIVLSARTAENYRIEGLNAGIDDYITKPFSVSYLKTRVSNIIRQRRQLQQRFMSQLNAGGNNVTGEENVAFADADREFADKLQAFIEEHIDDADLKIDDMALAVGHSRTVLYVKIKSYFGMAPVDFLRHFRITRAERMVAETKLSFSEIAYKTGFSDPRYFGRCFKKETGLTPSEYRKRNSGHA